MNTFENAIDDRAESFLQVGTVAKVIAEKHCDISIDDQTHNRWAQLMGLLREADTLADDTDVSSEEVLERLGDFSEFEDRYPALTNEAIGEDVREQLLTRTARVLRLGKQVARAISMDRFIALRIVEGREVTSYLEDAATPEVLAQTEFQDSFMPTMRSMAITANLLDSFTDGVMDYRQGKIARKPDGEYHRALLSAIPVQAKLASRALLHLPVMQEFAVMSGHRLVNRIKHRTSPTSSLAIFQPKRKTLE